MKRIKKRSCKFVVVATLLLGVISCKTTSTVQKTDSKLVPEMYAGVTGDTLNSGVISWKTYFKDAHLQVLIETALKNNQELNITMQEIEIAKNEVRAR